MLPLPPSLPQSPVMPVPTLPQAPLRFDRGFAGIFMALVQSASTKSAPQDPGAQPDEAQTQAAPAPDSQGAPADGQEQGVAPATVDAVDEQASMPEPLPTALPLTDGAQAMVPTPVGAVLPQPVASTPVPGLAPNGPLGGEGAPTREARGLVAENSGVASARLAAPFVHAPLVNSGHGLSLVLSPTPSPGLPPMVRVAEAAAPGMARAILAPKIAEAGQDAHKAGAVPVSVPASGPNSALGPAPDAAPSAQSWTAMVAMGSKGIGANGIGTNGMALPANAAPAQAETSDPVMRTSAPAAAGPADRVDTIKVTPVSQPGPERAHGVPNSAPLVGVRSELGAVSGYQTTPAAVPVSRLDAGMAAAPLGLAGATTSAPAALPAPLPYTVPPPATPVMAQGDGRAPAPYAAGAQAPVKPPVSPAPLQLRGPLPTGPLASPRVPTEPEGALSLSFDPVQSVPADGDRDGGALSPLQPHAQSHAPSHTSATPGARGTPAAVMGQIATALPDIAPNTPGFEIALDPVELGTVKFRMVATELGTTLFIQAERGETLDLLRRNIGALQQDLQGLGYDGVAFSFGTGTDSAPPSPRQRLTGTQGDTAPEPGLAPPPPRPSAMAAPDGRLNLRL